MSRQPQMATVLWMTWIDVDEIQVNDLRPILSSIGKQDRKQTDQFAPPAPPAKVSVRPEFKSTIKKNKINNAERHKQKNI